MKSIFIILTLLMVSGCCNRLARVERATLERIEAAKVQLQYVEGERRSRIISHLGKLQGKLSIIRQRMSRKGCKVDKPARRIFYDVDVDEDYD